MNVRAMSYVGMTFSFVFWIAIAIYFELPSVAMAIAGIVVLALVIPWALSHLSSQMSDRAKTWALSITSFSLWIGVALFFNLPLVAITIAVIGISSTLKVTSRMK